MLDPPSPGQDAALDELAGLAELALAPPVFPAAPAAVQEAVQAPAGPGAGGDDDLGELLADPAAINRGIEALRLARRARGAFVGQNRSPAHMSFVRSFQKLQAARRKHDKVKRSYSKLQDAWNRQVIRAGDLAQDIHSDDDGNGISGRARRPLKRRRIRSTCMRGVEHPHAWTTHAVMKVGFSSVGKRCGLARYSGRTPYLRQASRDHMTWPCMHSRVE